MSFPGYHMFSYLVSSISSGLWPLLRLFMFLMMEVLKVLSTYVCRMSLNLCLSNDFLITRLEMIWALGRKIIEVKLYSILIISQQGVPVVYIIYQWQYHLGHLAKEVFASFYFAKAMPLWAFLFPVLWNKLLSSAYTQGRGINLQLERRIGTYIMWNSSLRKIYLFSLIYLFYQ